MEIQSLGYVVVGSTKIDDWSVFATQLLGMQVASANAGLSLRMDDREQRLMIDPKMDEGRFHLGWEVADGSALDALASRLERSGVKLTRGSQALMDQRRVADLLAFKDPIGNVLEIFRGAARTAEPFNPGRPISGFRTGSLGFGHAVLTVAHIEQVLPFYRDVLGLHVSDYMVKPFKAYFFHVNGRHHSLALIETGTNGLHHLMVELRSLDDVGQGYDIAQAQEGRVGTTLGRHSNDFMTSFYARTPSPFMMEYGWGGRMIDPRTWKAVQLDCGPSLWGHEREWLPADRRAEARKMRMKAASDSMRAPVYVLPGTYVSTE